MSDVQGTEAALRALVERAFAELEALGYRNVATFMRKDLAAIPSSPHGFDPAAAKAASDALGWTWEVVNGIARAMKTDHVMVSVRVVQGNPIFAWGTPQSSLRGVLAALHGVTLLGETPR